METKEINDDLTAVLSNGMVTLKSWDANARVMVHLNKSEVEALREWLATCELEERIVS
jgi:arabinogalactan endo-1,4-beta-galactosidase